MNIFLGAINPSSFYFGDKTINKILFNDNIIFEKDNSGDSLDTPLTFTSVGGVSTIKFTQTGLPHDLNLEYSLDNGNTWIDDTSSKTYMTDGFILNDGEKLMLRATDAGNSYINNSAYTYHKITTTTNGEILVNGNIQTLLDKTGQRMDVPSYCYCEFFNGSDIKTPPMLPATTLGNDAYRGMFANCLKMVKFPELPATNLGYRCYGWFYGSYITENNEITLPATTLADYCYRNMIGDSNIKGVTINVSSVDSNVRWCFTQMFYNSKYLEYVKFPNLTYTDVKTLLTQNSYGNTDMFEKIPSEKYPLIKIICSDGEYTLAQIKG